MNPKENSELSVSTMLALRQESDALRVIAEKLRVKEMGPADHIRTKHEVKAFVENGNAIQAAEILKRAEERRLVEKKLTVRMSQNQVHRP
jgi:hypothetical protein